eukprot:g7125.t1
MCGCKSKEELRIVFRQLLMGLQHVHANGVVHCDIKPENVFVEEGPALQIKIGDFDISQDKDERATIAAEHGRTSLKVRGFTPMYMAPELLQQTGSRCSEASDPPPSVPSLDTLEPAERALLQKWLQQNPQKRSTIPELLALDLALVCFVAIQYFSLCLGLVHSGAPFFMEAEMELSQQMQRREVTRKSALCLATLPCTATFLHAELQQLQGEPRQCCTCGDDFFQADGLDCPANQPAHFACAACLSGHVQAESLKEMDQLRKAEGKVWCPLRLHGCEAKQPYEMGLLASRVTPEAFQAQIEAIRKVQEQKLSQDLEARYTQQLKEEMERYERLSAEQRQVQQARVWIQEELLTLKCPRPNCRRAFVDFDGCFALTCGACGWGFCAWCLEDCGEDAHTHVARCNANAAPGRQVYSPCPCSSKRKMLAGSAWSGSICAPWAVRSCRERWWTRCGLASHSWGCSSWQEATCAIKAKLLVYISAAS